MCVYIVIYIHIFDLYLFTHTCVYTSFFVAICREYLVPGTWYLTQTFRSRCQRFGSLLSNLAIAGSTFWHDAAVDIWCMCADVSIVSSENSVWVFMHVFLVSLHVQFPSIQEYVKNPLLEDIHFWGSKKPFTVCLRWTSYIVYCWPPYCMLGNSPHGFSLMRPCYSSAVPCCLAKKFWMLVG